MNNKITLIGTLHKPIASCESPNNHKYEFMLAVWRLSKAVDILPVVIDGEMRNHILMHPNQHYIITGELRNREIIGEHGKSRLQLYVDCRALAVSEKPTSGDIPNHVELTGFVSQVECVRKTPFGREICDLTIVAPREDDESRSDYIYCIAWGGNAHFATKLSKGQKVKIKGRFQSRDYIKKIDGKEIPMTAWELSITALEVADG